MTLPNIKLYGNKSEHKRWHFMESICESKQLRCASDKLDLEYDAIHNCDHVIYNFDTVT